MLTFFEVSAAPGYEFTFDVSVILQSLIRFPPDICEALELPGGCSLNLANNLISSHKSDNGEFKAGKLCGTEDQRKFYTQTLYAGSLVSRWMTTGYELSFTSIPSTPLSV